MKKWTARLPDSLCARTAVALFLGILALEAVLMLIGWLLVVAPLVHRSADDLAALMVRAGQLHAQLHGKWGSAEEAALLSHLDAIHQITLTRPNGPLAGDRSRLPYIRYLQQSLARRTGQPVAVLCQGSAYALDLPTEAGPLRISFRKNRIGTAPALTLTLMALLALLASLAAALLLARRITRPLADFVSRTEQLGRGQVPDHLPETGPRELRQLSQRFNILAGEVRELMDDRTVMLGGLSHDLRAPLARARMALELSRPSMEAELHARLERALGQMESMTSLYLDFAAGLRADVGPLARADAVLAALVAAAPPGRVTVDDGAAACPARIPETAFRRCAQNLLDNALKYGGDRPVQVQLRCIPGQTVLEILDRGSGIPSADQERVFRPFARLDPARSRPGSGLGLAVVRQICRAQGWHAELLPRPGGGTVARLVIT